MEKEEEEEERTLDGSVDRNGKPAVRGRSGNWTAAILLLGTISHKIIAIATPPTQYFFFLLKRISAQALCTFFNRKMPLSLLSFVRVYGLILFMYINFLEFQYLMTMMINYISKPRASNTSILWGGGKLGVVFDKSDGTRQCGGSQQR